jgi:hypothetical protein
MALASFAASLPIAAVTVRSRAAVLRRAMSSSSVSAASQARVGVVQMTSVGDLDANYATCSRLTKASPLTPFPLTLHRRAGAILELVTFCNLELELASNCSERHRYKRVVIRQCVQKN